MKAKLKIEITPPNFKVLPIRIEGTAPLMTHKFSEKMRKQIQGAEMSADEKRDTLTAIGQAENNLTANIQTLKKQVQ